MGLAKGLPDRESSGNPVATSGGTLVCPRWQTKLLVGSVTALAGTLASRPLFGSAIWGDQPPAHWNIWAFSYFLYDFLNYYLRGLGFLALDTSPRF